MGTEPNDDGRNANPFMRYRQSVIGIGLTLGIIVGIVIGSATDNMGLWIAMGTVIGLIVGAVIYTRLSAKPKE